MQVVRDFCGILRLISHSLHAGKHALFLLSENFQINIQAVLHEYYCIYRNLSTAGYTYNIRLHCVA